MILVCGIFTTGLKKPMRQMRQGGLVSGLLANIRCLSPFGLEILWYDRMRSNRCNPKRLTSVLIVVVGCAILLPFAITWTTSFKMAAEVCEERHDVKLLVLYAGEDYDYGKHATRFLFPKHAFNSVSTVVSFGGFLGWLFDRRQSTTKELDRKCKMLACIIVFNSTTFLTSSFSTTASASNSKPYNKVGSYYASRLLLNLFVQVTSLYICTTSLTLDTILDISSILLTGLAVVVPNVMCHRYLYVPPPPPSQLLLFHRSLSVCLAMHA